MAKLFSRWAAWEKAVLAKVDPDGKASPPLVASRQGEIDDDAEEAQLITWQFRDELQRLGHDPDCTCVFIPSKTAALWLKHATGDHWPTNRASGHLATLGIPELQKSKKNGCPGWRWGGKNADPDAKMQRLEKKH